MSTNWPDSAKLSRHRLVGLLRHWLAQGITRQNLASSVRVQAFKPYSAGLKADLVAEITLDVRAVVKKGDAQLLQHRDMMNAVNQLNRLPHDQRPGLQQALFPEVMRVEPIDTEQADTPVASYLMLMQALVGYQSLDDLLYSGSTPTADLAKALTTVLGYCDFIHSIQPGEVPELATLPSTPNPFSARIPRLLNILEQNDPILADIRQNPGNVNGQPCPALDEMLSHTIPWLDQQCRYQPPRLVHGDIHLSNIMIRQRGRSLSVRLIDPNPSVGFSHPMYDAGKLLHFLEPVGWVRHRPKACKLHWQPSQGSQPWSLSAQAPKAAESINKTATSMIAQVQNHFAVTDPKTQAMLRLATASAHLGLAAIKPGQQATQARRYVLSYALAALTDGYQLALGADPEQ